MFSPLRRAVLSSSSIAAESQARAAGPRRPTLGRAACMGVAAAVLYGNWAFHANLVAGLDAAVRAAGTQAVMSFTATLSMIVVLERLFGLARSPDAGFVLAIVGTFALSTTLMATLHALVGTPRILVTMAPSMGIALLFNASYAFGLRAAAIRAHASMSKASASA